MSYYFFVISARYLAAGDLQISLSFSYRISPAAVNGIIMSTCKELWKVLAPVVMALPTKEDWLKIAQDFDNMWHFPNCIGALDGKHVVIQAPNNSGSLFFNYKGTFSIVLMALVDANYKFIMVDVGGYGKASDGGVFGRSAMGAKFEAQELDIPEPRPLQQHGEPLPFVVVGDEAFPLKRYLLRPYPKNTSTLPRSHAIYNYRLSRARRVVENAFGILVQRFRVLYGRLQVTPKNADIIVLTCIALHNLLRNEVVHEQWTEDIPETNAFEPLPNIGTHASNTAIEVRNKFRRFFCGVGQVPWQDAVISRGRKE